MSECVFLLKKIEKQEAMGGAGGSNMLGSAFSFSLLFSEVATGKYCRHH